MFTRFRPVDETHVVPGRVIQRHRSTEVLREAGPLRFESMPSLPQALSRSQGRSRPQPHHSMMSFTPAPFERNGIMFKILALGFLFANIDLDSRARTLNHTIALRGATVVDVETGQSRPRQTVVIEGNRIVTVVPDQRVDVPTNALLIDAAGKYVIPGLWDMHIHLFSTKGSALPALVANGVTGIRDLGGLLREIEDWRVRIESGSMTGPRIVRCGPMLNGRQFGIQQIAVMNESEARGAVRALQRSGVDFIKVHRAISRDAYFGALAECRKLGIPLVGHVPNTVTPMEASDAGQACIEHVGTLFEGTFAAAHKDEPFAAALDHFSKVSATELFARFASNKTVLTPTLVAHRMVIQFGRAKPNERDKFVSRSARELAAYIATRDRDQLTPEFYERMEQQFRAALPLVKQMQDAGVRLLAGTDTGIAGTYPGFDLHDELELLVSAGLTPMQALQSATRNVAEFLRDNDGGLVAVGRRADLVLLEANPLEDIRNTRKIHAVIVGGKFLDRDALDRLLQEAERAAQTD